MKNLLRATATLIALAFGGVAQADILSVTESPDVFLTDDLPATSMIRIFYENTGTATDIINAVQFNLFFDPILDADVDNDGNADGFTAALGFLPLFTDSNTGIEPGRVLIEAIGGQQVNAGAVVELFSFNLLVASSTSPGVYDLDITFPTMGQLNFQVIGPNVNVTEVIDGAIVVNSSVVIPEPASLAMVGMAGLLGLGAVARRRLARKAG